VVEQLVVHGAPVDFRELCARAVPADTRALLLDLDRTVHLGRNMGELLGWEIAAYRGYGPQAFDRLERRRRPGRFALDWSNARATLRYVATGARTWALPGLHYLFWGKLAWRSSALRRLSFRALGPEPVSVAQRVPQIVLMHCMSELPLAKLRDLSARVFRRHASEQTILREDIAWLRRRSPSMRITLTSASPQPVVQVVAEELGVDEAIYSTLEERDDFLSAPARRDRLFVRAAAPRRLSPPGAVRINASRAKIEEIERRHPDVIASPQRTVGITDTGYGEDHCWASHLGCVVDVNSTAPFAPIVAASSPLRTIHSSALLTRAEREARDAGAVSWDPRRTRVPAHGPIALDQACLDTALADLVVRIDELMARESDAARACAPERARLEARIDATAARMAALVDAYNTAAEERRGAILAEIDALNRDDGRARRELARASRPVSEIACAIASTLASARARVEALVASGAGARSAAAAGARERGRQPAEIRP
jgi:hypothetical protein